MDLRQTLAFGIGITLAGIVPAAAQNSPNATATPPAPRGVMSAAGAPHTLAEALAATYANQPALQAVRATLRATDENVPAALSGWRPTVVVAGSAGYGNGLSRSYNSLLQAGRSCRPSATSARRRPP